MRRQRPKAGDLRGPATLCGVLGTPVGDPSTDDQRSAEERVDSLRGPGSRNAEFECTARELIGTVLAKKADAVPDIVIILKNFLISMEGRVTL